MPVYIIITLLVGVFWPRAAFFILFVFALSGYLNTKGW